MKYNIKYILKCMLFEFDLSSNMFKRAQRRISGDVLSTLSLLFIQIALRKLRCASARLGDVAAFVLAKTIVQSVRKEDLPRVRKEDFRVFARAIFGAARAMYT